MTKRSTGIMDSNGVELFEGDVVKFCWLRVNVGTGGIKQIKYHKMEKKSDGKWGMSGVENTIGDGSVTKENLPKGCKLHYSYEAVTKMPFGEYVWKNGGENYRKTITAFNDKIIKLDVGLFFSSPELSSSLPAGMMGPGSPAVSGTTEDARNPSIMPALAMVWGKEGSKHTFGASAFGISGFGVTFPEELNQPMSPNFNPSLDSNPINYPQKAGGFGRIESDYMLLQIGFTWAYEITEKLSVGVEPTFNYGSLQLMPNPTANPSAAG
jgi:hypothetical protein